MAKVDYKAQDKKLYQPGTEPSLIEVPPISFLMIDGKGDPDGPEYQEAVGALYALSYTIKMGRLGDGYFDYAVPPLEGLWWGKGGFSAERRSDWLWTAMIRQPEFVTPQVLEEAKEICAAKKPGTDVSKARLELLEEGLCVQAMHVGPYAAEPATVARMDAFLAANGMRDEVGETRKHHEIYLSDPRRTAPAKLKTVVRHPAGKA